MPPTTYVFLTLHSPEWLRDHGHLTAYGIFNRNPEIFLSPIMVKKVSGNYFYKENGTPLFDYMIKEFHEEEWIEKNYPQVLL